jgi:hypothetical protein
MHDLSSLAYMVAAALGIAGFWVPKLLGPAIAALAVGMLLIGR